MQPCQDTYLDFIDGGVSTLHRGKDRVDNSYLIGRQPILNRLEEIEAYELLFRSPRSLSSAMVLDSTQASARVIVNTLSGFGINEILGKHRGFINVETDLLMSDSIEILPAEMIGLELLENISITPGIVERCRMLKSRGCLLALDDHEYREDYEELYDGLIDIVKLDIVQTPLDLVYEMVQRFKKYPVKLLAEKIETRAAYLRSRRMGFELFQGYFFARPSLMQKKRLADSASILFELMRQLAGEANIAEIEQSFKKCPALTYKLLLLVNSVSIGLREKIRTVRHAITIIGISHLRRWVQLAIFAADDSRGLDNPIVDMAAVRAALMEGLARLHPVLRRFKCAPDQAFLVGILSLLKDVYDISMDEIVASLNLSEEIRMALIDKGGSLGALLELTEMIERLEFDAAAERISEMGISFMEVLDCQKKAYNWREGFN